jgi:hypothetical protein
MGIICNVEFLHLRTIVTKFLISNVSNSPTGRLDGTFQGSLVMTIVQQPKEAETVLDFSPLVKGNGRSPYNIRQIGLNASFLDGTRLRVCPVNNSHGTIRRIVT